MGNIGQSVAVFGAPVLALWFGDWRTVFFVNVPIGLLIVAALAVMLPATAGIRSRPRLDNLGALLQRHPVVRTWLDEHEPTWPVRRIEPERRRAAGQHVRLGDREP